MNGKYILWGKIPIPVEDPIEWAKGLEEENRRVGKDFIGEVMISTVFLGLDHSFGGGPPLLFETMIFGGELEGWQERCSTWEQAEEMHKKAMAMVREEEEFQKREREFEEKFK